MLKYLFFFVQIALTGSLIAQLETSSSINPESAVAKTEASINENTALAAISQTTDRKPEVMLLRESTLRRGNYTITIYKIVKQHGTSFYEVPNTAYLVIETLERLNRGNITVQFEFENNTKVGYVQEISIVQDHKLVLQALDNHIEKNFNCSRTIWHFKASDDELAKACKELRFETVIS